MGSDPFLIVIVDYMRRAWSGEPMPASGSREERALQDALTQLGITSKAHDFQVLGLLSVRLLIEHHEANLAAQRELIRAQLAAARGEVPPHPSH